MNNGARYFQPEVEIISFMILMTEFCFLINLNTKLHASVHTGTKTSMNFQTGIFHTLYHKIINELEAVRAGFSRFQCCICMWSVLEC